MVERYTLEQIRDYWTEQAKKFKTAHTASWADKMAIHLEIQEICKHLNENDNVLDIGCGNGYSTVQYALMQGIDILGLDYVPEMIESAKSIMANCDGNLAGRVDFGIGDILDLKTGPNQFDKVMTTRVLINLGDWEKQLKAINECIRVLKRNGLLLLSEATLQGWRNVNILRSEWGLEELPMPPFNQYLDQDKVIDATSSAMELVDIVNFSSTYYLGTRVLRPLLAKILGINKDYTNYDMEINRLFAQLPSCGDYGSEKLFILRKK